jgi:hypothetical protein
VVSEKQGGIPNRATLNLFEEMFLTRNIRWSEATREFPELLDEFAHGIILF